jgi:hypothetical protein
MPAGDHSAPFRAGSLPAGMYFATLRRERNDLHPEPDADSVALNFA